MMGSVTEDCLRIKHYWEEQNLQKLGFKSGADGWEARSLPLCYAAPSIDTLMSLGGSNICLHVRFGVSSNPATYSFCLAQLNNWGWVHTEQFSEFWMVHSTLSSLISFSRPWGTIEFSIRHILHEWHLTSLQPHHTIQPQRHHRGLREASMSKEFQGISIMVPFIQTPKLKTNYVPSKFGQLCLITFPSISQKWSLILTFSFLDFRVMLIYLEMTSSSSPKSWTWTWSSKFCLTFM